MAVTNEEFNKMDRMLIEAMMKAEQSLRIKKSGNYEWSPLLSKAGWSVRFWKRRLSDLKARRRNIQLSEKYRSKAQIQANEATTINRNLIKTKLRKATRMLRKAQTMQKSAVQDSWTNLWKWKQ